MHRIRHPLKVQALALLVLSALAATPTTAGAIECGSPPLAEPPCYGIGPGALMHAQAWTSCSTSFLVRNSTSVFIWTAGHCTREVGQSVWFYYPAPGMPDEPTLMEQRPADGVVVYRPGAADDNQVPPPLDFSLVELKASAWQWLRPSMPVWPGPTTTFTDWERDPAVVHLYGHVVGADGTPAEARSGLGPMSVADETFTFAMTVENGDSGAPLVDDSGAAMGIAVWHIVPGVAEGHGNGVAVRLDYVMEQAWVDAGLDLQLVTSLEDLSDLTVVLPPATEQDDQDPRGTDVKADAPGGLATLGIVLAVVVLCVRLGRNGGR